MKATAAALLPRNTSTSTSRIFWSLLVMPDSAVAAGWRSADLETVVMMSSLLVLLTGKDHPASTLARGHRGELVDQYLASCSAGNHHRHILRARRRISVLLAWSRRRTEGGGREGAGTGEGAGA